jgi:hypothetical protein
MKFKLFALLFSVLAIFITLRAFAADAPVVASFEYITIRWAGRENTHVVRPGGVVEMLGPEFRKFSKPDKADDRAFYMNIAMNGLTREGYEFAGMSSDEIVMKRGK